MGLISTSCTLLDPSNRSWFEILSQICQIPPIIGCIQYKIMKTPIKRHFFSFFHVFCRKTPQKPPETHFWGGTACGSPLKWPTGEKIIKITPCAGQRSDQVIPGQIYDQVHLVRSDQVHLVMTRYTWS